METNDVEANGNGKKAEIAAEEIAFHYLKSNHFRVVHADGVWGGPTSDQRLHMAIWSERPVIPKVMVFGVTSSGQLGPELKERRDARDGIVREVEVDVVMSLDTARSLVEWLKKSIEISEKIAATDSNG
jgi:hypothetical protein